MNNPWQETGAQPLSRIVDRSDWKCSETQPVMSVSIGEEPPSPTAAHKACIAELLLRFPCPRDIDPESYQARASLLAKDCAALQPGLLRKACDRAAQTARGLPYASEILTAAATIVAERQAAQPGRDAFEPGSTASIPTGSFAPGSSEHRDWIATVNRIQAFRRAPSRLVLDDTAQQSRTVWLAEGWICNGDGTVTGPAA